MKTLKCANFLAVGWAMLLFLGPCSYSVSVNSAIGNFQVAGAIFGLLWSTPEKVAGAIFGPPWSAPAKVAGAIFGPPWNAPANVP